MLGLLLRGARQLQEERRQRNVDSSKRPAWLVTAVDTRAKAESDTSPFLMRWKDKVVTVKVGEELECDLRVRFLESVVPSPRSPKDTPSEKKQRTEEEVITLKQEKAMELQRAMFDEECQAADAKAAKKAKRLAAKSQVVVGPKHLLG